ncbi:conserved hypothetical protein, CHP03806, HNE020 0 family [Formosa agariphila KMM 3901]|uniref:Repeat protein (TIGR03806 family) n=1 Tax=Formosa agariphila (strain DSM 15362 / KCTC 12365 / LMG 23005 / KMM 3901 / M-2Alg 35-1) TaxID=1347342 RepID=T2KIF4_FORAG|nr:SO2930 family diheme c-type cytochrome [Formosa agariphila]CDF77754.1 conserved hypothetical protein, CHP03806, HNE020 0 family [Formosa agariphila KMM 3901]
MKLIKNICSSVLVLFLLISCGSDDSTIDVPVENNELDIPTGVGHELLSEYNFFEGDLKNLTPNTEAGVIPYDLNTKLFSDYAFKKRFLYVPEGQSIPMDTTQVLSFPVGSVLIKNFYYTDNGVDNIIETRLLIKRTNEWQPETYKWNEGQTDAVKTIIGATVPLTVSVNGQEESFNYLIPNQNQCINCHALKGKIEPIGPKIQNLNRDYAYHTGTDNQLDMWMDLGILDTPSFSEPLPKWHDIDDTSASVNDRARAYLDVNCASCHRLGGSAYNSGLFLGYYNEDPNSLGVYKSPIAAGNGSGGFKYVIDPGNADESILLYRMKSSEVDVRMPEIGRELVHEEGTDLIEAWINSL